MVGIERVSTGIAGLDAMAEGGFERGSIVIIAGESGTGKTIAAMQFLHAGATAGEAGLFITFEEKREKIIRYMSRFGWDLPSLEAKKKLAIYEYAPHEIERFVREGGLIEDMIKRNAVARLVVDSITSYAILFEGEHRRRQALVDLFTTLRRWGCTTLLPSEAFVVVPEGAEVRARFGIEYLADALLAIHSVRMGDVREMAFEIVKMRGTAHSRKLAPMKITDKGIVVYPDQPFFAKAF